MAFYIQKGGEKRIIIDHDSVVSATTGINNDTYGTTNTFSDELGKTLKYFDFNGYLSRDTHNGDMIVKNGQIIQGDFLANNEQGRVYTYDYEFNAVRVIEGSSVPGAIELSGSEDGSMFGRSVDMADGFLVIGALGSSEDTSPLRLNYQYGAVHLFDHQYNTTSSTPIKTVFADDVDPGYISDDLGWGIRVKYNAGSVYVSGAIHNLDKLNLDPAGLSSNWFTRQEVLDALDEVSVPVFGDSYIPNSTSVNYSLSPPVDEGRIFLTFGYSYFDGSNTDSGAAWSHNALGLNNFTSKTYGATAGEHHQHIFISPPEFWPAEDNNHNFAKVWTYNHTVYGWYEFRRGQGDTGPGSTYATTLSEWDRADGAFPVTESCGLIALDMDSGEFKGFVDAHVNETNAFALGDAWLHWDDTIAFGCGYIAQYTRSTVSAPFFAGVAIYRAGTRELIDFLNIAYDQTGAESYAVQDPRYGIYVTDVDNLKIADGYLWLNCGVRTNADSYTQEKAYTLRYTLPPSLEMDIEIASEGDRYLVDWDKGYGNTDSGL